MSNTISSSTGSAGSFSSAAAEDDNTLGNQATSGDAASTGTDAQSTGTGSSLGQGGDSAPGGTATPGSSADKFGLPENAAARAYAQAGTPNDPTDDGASCRRDPSAAETPAGPVQGSVTVQARQSVLGALKSSGVSASDIPAAYGSLVTTGQLKPAEFKQGTPVVQPGRQFQLDSSQFTKENAAVGQGLVRNEQSNRDTAAQVKRDAAAKAADNKPAPDAGTTPRLVAAIEQPPSAYTKTYEAVLAKWDDIKSDLRSRNEDVAVSDKGGVLTVLEAVTEPGRELAFGAVDATLGLGGLNFDRIKKQVASSTLIMTEPLVKAGAQLAARLGADVDPEAVGDNMFGAAAEMIKGSPLPAGSDKISYSNAMGMPVAPVGIEKFDKDNITYHDYQLDTTLCKRTESFCNIPNLAPLIDHSSAPKADWTGFHPMENGPQKLVMDNPIIHNSDLQKGTFVNRTTSDHLFHSGTVESKLYWKGDELHLKTTGYGYGATPMHTAANYGIGLAYFGMWQTAVKADVQAIRVFKPD